MESFVLGLGSNLGDRLGFLRQACFRLEQALGPLQNSPVYESLPLLGMEQPLYCNQVVGGQTGLPPQALLEQCLRIEQELGRIRTEHWGPRTIDIDVLAYGAQVIEEPGLQVPHPGIEQRSFVLLPWMSLDPDWRHPRSGLSVAQLWANWQAQATEPPPQPLETR